MLIEECVKRDDGEAHGMGRRKGVMTIIKGQYRGRIVYYDDDGGTTGNMAVVYFGEPLNSESALVRHPVMMRATDEEKERFAAEHLTAIPDHLRQHLGLNP